jgi:hypothetical protein
MNEPTKVSGEEKPRCGLCGKAGKLTRAPCCGHWICADTDKYVPFSYARNSCFTNHSKYTICAAHHAERHDGRWQDCARCLEMMPMEMYVHSATNEYNFEKLENPPPFQLTPCSRCSVGISLAHDVYIMKGKDILCAACSEVGDPGQFRELFDPQRLTDFQRELTLTRMEQQSKVQPRKAAAKTGRNDPCPCGSGMKYKKCCGK